MFGQEDFNGWMGAKYNAIQQNANSESSRARSEGVRAAAAANQSAAEAAKTAAETGQIPANAAALRALQGAESGNLGATTAHTRAEIPEIAPNAASQRALQGATTSGLVRENSLASPEVLKILQTQQLQALHPLGERPPAAPSAPTQNFDINTTGVVPNFHTGGNVSSALAHAEHSQNAYSDIPHGYTAGADKIPGKTPKGMVGTKASDVVPAMLAPGEAVLNKHAADMMGREKIAAANAIGNHIAKTQDQGAAPAGPQLMGKGMTPPKGKAGPGAPMSHFADGADNVPADYAGIAAKANAFGTTPSTGSGGGYSTGRIQQAPGEYPLPAGYSEPGRSLTGMSTNPMDPHHTLDGAYITNENRPGQIMANIRSHPGGWTQTAEDQRYLNSLPANERAGYRDIGRPLNDQGGLTGYGDLTRGDSGGPYQRPNTTTNSTGLSKSMNPMPAPTSSITQPTHPNSAAPSGSVKDLGTLTGDHASDWAEFTSQPGYSKGTAKVKPQHLADGTHMVSHGKSAKTPTKINPAAIVALMQSMHQGPAMAGAPGPSMGGGIPGLCRGGMV